MTMNTELVEGVRVVRLDDGKANVLGAAEVAGLRAELSTAGARGEALVLTGRAGMLSGGLDTRVLAAGGDGARELLGSMGSLLVEVLRSPTPVVVAASGHAVAAGAMLLLVADRSLIAAGDHRIGFSEVAGGLALPSGVVELARATVAAPWLRRLTAQAQLVGPDDAVTAGFASSVEAPADLLDEAVGVAARLSALDPTAFARTKQLVNAPLADRLAALG